MSGQTRVRCDVVRGGLVFHVRYCTLCAGTYQLYLLSPWQLLGELVQSCGEIYKDFVVGTVYEQPNRGACLYQTRVIPCKRLLMVRLPCSLETHVVWSSSETIEELAFPILCFGRPTHNAFLKTRLRGLNFGSVFLYAIPSWQSLQPLLGIVFAPLPCFNKPTMNHTSARRPSP